MALKKGDFVELDFVGKVSATNQVFESTLEKKEPLVVCIGSGMLLKALDVALEGKEIDQEFELELKPDDAFGPRNPQLVQLTNLNIFKQNKVNPIPGLQLNIDGMLATVRSVTGGRVIIDFNHPLAGKNVKFWIKIIKKVESVEEKLKALCSGWSPEIKAGEKEIEVKIDRTRAELSSAGPSEIKDFARELPEKIAELKIKKIKELVPEIKEKEIKFIEKSAVKT